MATLRDGGRPSGQPLEDPGKLVVGQGSGTGRERTSGQRPGLLLERHQETSWGYCCGNGQWTFWETGPQPPQQSMPASAVATTPAATRGANRARGPRRRRARRRSRGQRRRASDRPRTRRRPGGRQATREARCCPRDGCRRRGSRRPGRRAFDVAAASTAAIGCNSAERSFTRSSTPQRTTSAVTSSSSSLSVPTGTVQRSRTLSLACRAFPPPGEPAVVGAPSRRATASAVTTPALRRARPRTPSTGHPGRRRPSAGGRRRGPRHRR